MRRAGKVDTTQRAIVAGLRAAGYAVRVLNADVDLEVLGHGRVVMLDCKSDRTPITIRQLRLVEDGWPLKFVRTLEEAIRAMEVRE